jgi:hypothetical protein
MRVKIGDTWHSPEDQPISIELNDGERRQISKMEGGVRLYAQYPDTMSPESMRIWMAEGAKLSAGTKTEMG